MEDIERHESKYLGSGDKKKHILLTSYIKSLLKNDRVIEAAFFQEELLMLKPEHPQVHALGYEIAIRSFNYKNVVMYDGFLSKNKKCKEELLKLRVKYSYSIQNSSYLESTIDELLPIFKFDKDYFPILVESIFFNRSISNIKSLLMLLRKNNLKLDPKTETNIKKIAYEKLCDQLVRVANG